MDAHEQDPRWQEFFGSSLHYAIRRQVSVEDKRYQTYTALECARCHALIPYVSTVGHINWHAVVDTAATALVPLTRNW